MNSLKILGNSYKESNTPSCHTLMAIKNKPKRIDDETTPQLESANAICSQISSCSHGAKLVRDWTVDQVCQFVESIPSCKHYVEVSLLN